jgi:hypothetical protein
MNIKEVFKTETLALELENYIRDYVPNGWKESIETAMFVPWVSVQDLMSIMNRVIPSKFSKQKFQEAIYAWLKEKNF